MGFGCNVELGYIIKILQLWSMDFLLLSAAYGGSNRNITDIKKLTCIYYVVVERSILLWFGVDANPIILPAKR